MSFAKYVAAALIIAAVAAVLIFFVFPKFPQTKFISDGAMNLVSKAKSFIITPTGILASVGGVTGLVAIGGTLYSKFNQAKTQLSNATSQLQSQTSKITELENKLKASEANATAQAQTYEQKLVDLKNTASAPNTALNDLQSKLNDATGKLNASMLKNQDLQAQYDKLRIQYEEVRNLVAVR